MPDTLARGRQLAAQLSTAGITATTDVRKAIANLPCVLVPPPRIEEDTAGGGVLLTWRLVALAADATGSEEAWRQLVELVDGVIESGLPVEVAEPTSYQLAADIAPVPAYLLTVMQTTD